MNIKNNILSIILLLIIPISMMAHPHMFVEYTAELIFDETGLQGIQTEWTFDEMFSWQVIDENTNGDEVIDDQEQKKIYQNAFSYLADTGCFAEFWDGFERYEVKEVQNFKASIKNGQLIYSFYLPWKVKAESETKMIKFLFNDPSYYCAVTPIKNGVKLIAPENIQTDMIMQDRVTYQISFQKVDK